MQKPNIYRYDNFREFLKDMYLHKKEANYGFSFRVFSRVAGFTSPNIYKLVMDGERNLTLNSIRKFSNGLKLKKREREYFEILVAFNQATQNSEKNYYFERLQLFKEFRKARPIQKDQYEYFTHWYHTAIRELAGTKGFRADPVWIAKSLYPKISIKEAHDALVKLIKLGLIKKINGKYVQTDKNLTTGSEVESATAFGYHKQMLNLAINALDLNGDERNISAVSMSLSKTEFDELKEMIFKFYRSIQGWLDSSKKDAEIVCQLNFQLFPLTRRNEDEKNN